MISGNSAGGHLTAMATATDWPGAYDLPADILKAALPISGLFDLAPFPFTYLQPAVQLTWDQVRRKQPSSWARRHPAPSRSRSAVLKPRNSAANRRLTSIICGPGSSAVTYLELPGRNHLDVLDEFAEGGALLGALREIADRRSMEA